MADLIPRSRSIWFAALVVALTGHASVYGQTEPNEPVAVVRDAGLTAERVEKLLQELEQTPAIDGEARVQVGDAYRLAIKDLHAAAELESRRASLAADAESVATRIQQIKQQLDELSQKQPNCDEGLTLTELEQRLPNLELQLATQKKARQSAEAESQARSQRRKEIRARLVALQERIGEIQVQIKSLAPSEVPAISAARGVQLAAHRAVLEKESATLEAELTKYDAEEASDLVRARIDLATRQAAFTEKCIEALQKRIKTAREAVAEQSVRKARQEAVAADPSLKRYADHNQELAEKAKSIAKELAKAEQDLKAATEVHESLIRQFNQTRKKVESVGLTSSVGALLRKQKSNLPDVSERRFDVATRQALINDTQYQLFEYEDERQDLGDTDAFLAEILAKAKADGNRDIELIESAAKELLDRKGEYLDALIRNNGQFFDTLIELDTTDQQVIKLAAEYRNYIDERVLWIRSGRALTTGFSVDPSDTWLISPAEWSRLGSVLLSDIRRSFWMYLIALAPLVTLLVRGRAIRRLITKVGESSAKANCRSIVPTLRTSLLTLIVSLPWPLVCVFLGWRLRRTAGDAEFVLAAGNGLLCVGLLWLAIEVMRQACRPMGLGEAHFRWSARACSYLRRSLRMLTALAFPFAFATATLSASHQTHGRDSMERVTFLIGMCATALVVFRLLAPRGCIRDYLTAHKGGWIERLKYVWPTAAACVPLSLACLSFAGYYYTAQVLFWRLFATCVFVASLFVVRSLLFRMLLLRRRYLSMEQSRQRAAAAVASGESNAQVVAGIVTEDPQADISAHSVQSRRLISTGMLAGLMVGMWLIWVQVLPALSMLDNYPVWPRSSTPAVATAAAAAPSMLPGTGTTGNAAAEPTTKAETVVNATTGDHVTVSDLALAILIAFVTFVISRNGPGLLEISILQQLPVDASVRYAVTTLVSYAIVLVGTILACSTIGLQWSQIQWLATALTFGLAFGLQEMFANFVAGLIILLERPIRVGDIVTVDDVTGVVSRIRIRATAITNWDRKEYVVPNKEFITGRLLNWTLSDKVNRIVIEVGLAYGSDTERAREILLSVANNHPAILKDPPSLATFEGFGDNSLNLVLRTYLPTLDGRLEVIHQLHSAIDKAFRAERIEIAFPQRDLHLRTVPRGLAAALEDEYQEEESRRDAA